MSEEMYNLQVPIPTTIKDQLKILAKSDDRSLRAFCKKILKDYVNGNLVYINENTISQNFNRPKLTEDTKSKKDEVDIKEMNDYSISFD